MILHLVVPLDIHMSGMVVLYVVGLITFFVMVLIVT